MAVELVRSSLLAEMVKKRMVLSVTPIAEKDFTVLVQSVGNTAQITSEMMAPSVTNLQLMVEVLDMPSGIETTVRETTLISVARNGEQSGTLSAKQTSTMLLAVSVHQTAPPA